MANYEKTAKAAIKAFTHQRHVFPNWKIHDTGKSRILDQNLNENDPVKSTELLESAIGKLAKGGMYSLNMFKPGRRSHGAPNASINFLNEDEETVSGIQQQPVKVEYPVHVDIPAPRYETKVAPPENTERIGLSDHIQLIMKKAEAESKIAYMEGIIADQAKTIAELENEINELDDENEKLEKLIEELNAEEEVEEGVQGEEAPVTLESALAGLIKENGAMIVENLMGGGLKDQIEDPLQENEEETDNVKISGITADLYERYTIEDLNETMLTINPNWKKHLFKLVQIGQQKPATFKHLIKQLENF